MILTIYEDVKFDQSPSWIFSKPMILSKNFKFLQSFHKVKLDLEIMFVDVLE